MSVVRLPMVYCVVWNTGIYRINPVFFNDTLSSEICRYNLEKSLLPYLKDRPQDYRCRFSFQQDGSAPHFGQNVRQLLNAVLPRRCRSMGWPPRSPDLKPVFQFILGHLRSTVYNNSPQTLIALQDNIRRACKEMPSATFRNMRSLSSSFPAGWQSVWTHSAIVIVRNILRANELYIFQASVDRKSNFFFVNCEAH